MSGVADIRNRFERPASGGQERFGDVLQDDVAEDDFLGVIFEVIVQCMSALNSVLATFLAVLPIAEIVKKVTSFCRLKLLDIFNEREPVVVGAKSVAFILQLGFIAYSLMLATNLVFRPIVSMQVAVVIELFGIKDSDSD